MSKKAEARIAKRIAADLKAREKSARLLLEPDAHVIRSEYAKAAPRQIRIGADPGSIYQLQVTWSCEEPDCEGAWQSGTSRDWGDEWDRSIGPKLNEFAKLTWAEVERMMSDTGHRMHHPMPTERISEEAQWRLLEIDRESDTIYRFRLGNLPRLWGFRIVAEFKVLWYDPKHEIYPVEHS